MMRRLFATLLLLSLFAAACGSDDAATTTGADDAAERAGDAGSVRVVASFYPMAEAAERVGGDLVAVENLTPAGTEPHDLELTPDQVDDLLDADLVFYLGQGFQPAVEEVASGRDKGSVDLLGAVELEEGAVAEDDEAEDEPGDDDRAEEGALDPHFWLDPALMSAAVGRIEAELAEAAPEHADAFAANADEYRAELTDLDGEFEQALAECERREIVTAHAAFHYLAERYDLEQLPISGLSPESEPDPRRLDELADLIEEEGLTTVFYETLVAPDVAETVAREAGVETAVLNPLEGLSNEDVEAGKDYAGVMRDNLGALTDALGCG